MILATDQELKILLNRIKFLEEELEKTKKSLNCNKRPNTNFFSSKRDKSPNGSCK